MTTNNQVVLVNQSPHVLVPKDEYDKLVEENKELNNTLLILKSNERILQETINNHEKTIEELRKENKELKEEIRRLKETVNVITTKHNNLHVEHNNLKVEHNNLKVRYNTLEAKLNKKELNDLMKKYLIAIQDFNNEEQLERKIINLQELNELKSIRQRRVLECHYLVNTMTQQEKDNRIIVLRDNLINMPNDVKLKFNNKYPTIIPELLKYCPSSSVTISTQDEDDINEDFWL